MVAAEQDAEVAPRRAAGLVDEVDLAGHALGFVHAVAALPDPDAFAVGLCAPQRLGVLVRIVGDQRIGHAQHAVAAAVVLFALDYLRRRVVPGQLRQVLRVGGAPGVGAMVVG